MRPHVNMSTLFRHVNISPCLWLQLVTEVPMGICIRNKFKLKIDRSVKTPWEEYAVVAGSLWWAPGLRRICQDPITRSFHLLYWPSESTLSRIFLFLDAPHTGAFAGVLIRANHKTALVLYCCMSHAYHTKVFLNNGEKWGKLTLRKFWYLWGNLPRIQHVFRNPNSGIHATRKTVNKLARKQLHLNYVVKSLKTMMQRTANENAAILRDFVVVVRTRPKAIPLIDNLSLAPLFDTELVITEWNKHGTYTVTFVKNENMRMETFFGLPDALTFSSHKVAQWYR